MPCKFFETSFLEHNVVKVKDFLWTKTVCQPKTRDIPVSAIGLCKKILFNQGLLEQNIHVSPSHNTLVQVVLLDLGEKEISIYLRLVKLNNMGCLSKRPPQSVAIWPSMALKRPNPSPINGKSPLNPWISHPRKKTIITNEIFRVSVFCSLFCC